MKHPRYEVLQDYFENALNAFQENLVKEHLLNCDECTRILAQFTAIETKVKSQNDLVISELTKMKIFSDAKAALAHKRLKKELQEERKEKLKLYLEEWKESLYPQIRIPALQLASLSLVLIVLVAVEKQGGSEDLFEPLNDDVQELTYKDISPKNED